MSGSSLSFWLQINLRLFTSCRDWRPNWGGYEGASQADSCRGNLVGDAIPFITDFGHYDTVTFGLITHQFGHWDIDVHGTEETTRYGHSTITIIFSEFQP